MIGSLYIFAQLNRNNWGKIVSQFNRKLHDELLKQHDYDFQINLNKSGKKRSRNQLRTYWRLVRTIKNYMNEQGNLFTDDEVSDWIKIQANFYVEINNCKIAKSIADRANCTVKEMRAIIEFILAFGIEYNIQDCYIRDEELEELLKFYQFK